jgi:hypothetical protein
MQSCYSRRKLTCFVSLDFIQPCNSVCLYSLFCLLGNMGMYAILQVACMPLQLVSPCKQVIRCCCALWRMSLVTAMRAAGGAGHGCSLSIQSSVDGITEWNPRGTQVWRSWCLFVWSLCSYPVIWGLSYAFFWVIHWHLQFKCQHCGMPCPIFPPMKVEQTECSKMLALKLHRLFHPHMWVPTHLWGWNRHSVLKHRHLTL